MYFPSGFKYSAAWLRYLAAAMAVLALLLLRDVIPGWLTAAILAVFLPVVMMYGLGLFVGMLLDWYVLHPASSFGPMRVTAGFIIRIVLTGVWLIEIVSEVRQHNLGQGVISTLAILGLWTRPIYDYNWMDRVGRGIALINPFDP
jgi:hypothetical protein